MCGCVKTTSALGTEHGILPERKPGRGILAIGKSVGKRLLVSLGTRSPAEDEGAGDHVVERLFALGEAGEHVANFQWD